MWLIVHPDLKRLARVRAALAWCDIFDKRTPILGGPEVKVGILRRDRSVGRGSGDQRCSMAVGRRQANSSQLKSGEAGQR